MSMKPTKPDWIRMLGTMLLGLAMALSIAVFAQPDMAWLGFVLAAAYGEAGRARSCVARLTKRHGT